MKILVDTNRIVAALIRAGTTRNIIFDDHFEFLTQDYALTEINEHEDELLKKTRLTREEFGLLLALIFEHITIIPHSGYGHLMEECKNDISDPDDIPHLAACLASNAEGILAHDKHFLEQHKVRVFTNGDILRFTGNAVENGQETVYHYSAEVATEHTKNRNI